MEAKKGDWVQISQVLLEPGKRAPQVPEDTQQCPLNMLVKGFLTGDADIGDSVTVTTVLGRTISGKLVAVNPGYTHSFGCPPEMFMEIGTGFKELMGDVD